MLVGADVNGTEAIFVVLGDDGSLATGMPARVSPREDDDAGARLHDFKERVVQHLRAVDPATVVLTDTNLSQTGTLSVRARAELEAAIKLAAHECQASVTVVHQKSVASHLGLAATADKRAVRKTVIGALPSGTSLSPEPDRRARAIGAVWVAAGLQVPT